MLRALHRRLLVATALAASCCAAPAAAHGAAVLRLDGIGPLKLGMGRVAAVRTGWLAHRGTGCPLGGPPVPVTYRLAGAAAPRGLRGMVQFEHGRLTNVSVTRGARTSAGVRVGHTAAIGMVRRYRRAGFAASAGYEPVFDATFVRVRRHGRQVVGGIATGPAVTVLAVPNVLTCE
ncbi:MAG TPA: hypothetical protein VFT50_03285 [Baekduia sp.]|nr:hypothetical protein [Baekduia sp.]